MMDPLSATQNGARPGAPDDQQKLEQAARAFEAIFVRNMIGAMRQASLGDDLTGNSGGDQFRDLMDDHLADAMSGKEGAGGKGLGIADMLIAQWKDRL